MIPVLLFVLAADPWPILNQRCLGCHNHELDDGDISFENRETLVNPRGAKGAAIIPGSPEKSPLVQAVRRTGEFQMPPGTKLADPDIETIMEWVRRGAPWPKL